MIKDIVKDCKEVEKMRKNDMIEGEIYKVGKEQWWGKKRRKWR